MTEKQGLNCTEGPLLSIYEVTEKLKEPFSAQDIEWRVQRSFKNNNSMKAIVVPYVQNRAIMQRLDDIFGPFGWENDFKEIHSGVLCGISIWVNGQKITKWDGADLTNIEATKGAISGSMKRAAVQFGIGRYLYNLTEVWVDVYSIRSNQKDENYINDKKNNVTGYWKNPQLPAWALPGGKDHSVEGNQSYNHGNQSRSTSSSGQNKGQKTNNNQTSNGKNNSTGPKPFDPKQALRAIYDQENIIGLPNEMKLPLFKKANQNTKTPAIINGTEKELQNYFGVLKPVAALVSSAKLYNLNPEQLLNYCQIVLKVQLKDIPSLFFKVKKEDVEQIIAMIRQEAQGQRTA
ncbi:Rad52/Rad22 family DNA repair protein [Sutcliffiella sp. NPDC057660]|uniref:Rad52/Rad22 family DNA repair protein n=1 Tax=Sutcliffiella sp. NPDC057660 TaxID=3346199 RepID=UPI003692EF87